LPPPQIKLEADYRRELGAHFGVVFTRLYTLTNMPIKRFRHALERDGELAGYMELLASSFNPRTVEALMCRSLVSVSWTGELHDCDFHQMLDIDLGGGRRPAPTIWDIEDFDDLAGADVATASHCFGCTAGAGSSCGGALE
jgi:radical SAM/Cys-rich protein